MVQMLLRLIGIVGVGWLLLLPQMGLSQEARGTESSQRYQEVDVPASGRRWGTPVHIRVTAVAIHLDKLRQIGLDWDLSPEKLDEISEKHGGRFYTFVHSLANGDSAHVILAPHLSVIAGQKGSMEVSSWNLAVTPKFQENGDIQLELTMKGELRFPYSRSAGNQSSISFRPPESSVEVPLDLTKKVVIRPGATAFLARPKLEVKAASKPRRSQTKSEPVTDSEPVAETADAEDEPDLAVLLFAQVDTQPLDRPNATAIEKPSRITPGLTPVTPVCPPYGHPRVPPPPTTIPSPAGPLPVSPTPAEIPTTEY